MAQSGKIKPHVLRFQDDHVIGGPRQGQNVIVVAVRYGATTKHRLAAFEQVNHFIQTYFRHGTDLLCRSYGLRVPHRPSTCAKAASAWGSQNVMSMARYSAMAAARSVRAWSTRPIRLCRVPRPRWQWATSGRMPSSSARAKAWR